MYHCRKDRVPVLPKTTLREISCSDQFGPRRRVISPQNRYKQQDVAEPIPHEDVPEDVPWPPTKESACVAAGFCEDPVDSAEKREDDASLEIPVQNFAFGSNL